MFAHIPQVAAPGGGVCVGLTGWSDGHLKLSVGADM